MHEIKTGHCILDLDIHSTMTTLPKPKDPEPERIVHCAAATPSTETVETEMKTQCTTDIQESVMDQSTLSAFDAVAGLPQYITERFGNVQINDVDDCGQTEEMKTEVVERDMGSWRAPKMENDGTNVPDSSTKTNCTLSMDDMNEIEDRMRAVVQEEVGKSEKRIEEKMSEMMGQMHSDLVEQFITNDLSTEKNIEKLFQFMVEFKHQVNGLTHDLKYAKF